MDKLRMNTIIYVALELIRKVYIALSNNTIFIAKST